MATPPVTKLQTLFKNHSWSLHPTIQYTYLKEYYDHGGNATVNL